LDDYKIKKVTLISLQIKYSTPQLSPSAEAMQCTYFGISQNFTKP
jgi:hypothetical protein